MLIVSAPAPLPPVLMEVAAEVLCTFTTSLPSPVLTLAGPESDWIVTVSFPDPLFTFVVVVALVETMVKALPSLPRVTFSVAIPE